MRLLITVLAVVAVSALFWVFLRSVDRLKRLRERRITEPSRLPRRKLRADETWEVPLSPGEALARVAAWAEARAARFARRDGACVIVYTGDGAKVAFDGIVGASADEMPLRIAAESIPASGGSILRLMLDEDFGYPFGGGGCAARQPRISPDSTDPEVREESV